MHQRALQAIEVVAALAQPPQGDGEWPHCRTVVQ